MKAKNLALIILAFTLFSCDKPINVNVESPKTAADTNSNTAKPDSAIVTSLCLGGEYGRIDVRGIVVKNENNQTTLDERIEVKQTTGQSDKGTPSVKLTEKNKATLSTDIEMKELAQLAGENTYINFGCELSENLTKGFVEIQPEMAQKKDKTFINAAAAKIFICGPQSEDKIIFSMKAEEILMKNVTMNVLKFTGLISISTYKLQLFGKNQIKTQGTEITTTFFAAPSILLNVTQELFGKGQLSLQSLGGDCVVAKEAK